MPKIMLMSAMLAAVLAGEARAGASDYRIEPAATAPAGVTSELVVHLRHASSGAYVPNAQIWHVERHQAHKAPGGFVQTRRAMAADGAGGYRLALPLHAHGDALEHLVVAVPGESASFLAAIHIPAAM